MTYKAVYAYDPSGNWLIERDCTPLAFDYYLDQGTVLMPEPGPARA